MQAPTTTFEQKSAGDSQSCGSGEQGHPGESGGTGKVGKRPGRDLAMELLGLLPFGARYAARQRDLAADLGLRRISELRLLFESLRRMGFDVQTDTGDAGREAWLPASDWHKTRVRAACANYQASIGS